MPYQGKGSLYYDDDDDSRDDHRPHRGRPQHPERRRTQDDDEEDDDYDDHYDDRRPADKPRKVVPGRLSPTYSGSVATYNESNYEHQLTDRSNPRRVRTDPLRRENTVDRAAPIYPPAHSGPQQSISAGTGEAAIAPGGALYRTFIQIDFNDFETIARLANRSPEILNINPTNIQQDAMRYLMQGEDDYASRCMQRVLILKHCSGMQPEKAIREIYELKNRGKSFKVLCEHYKLLEDAMYQKLQERSNQPAVNTQPTIPQSVGRPSIAGSVILDESMARMNLGAANPGKTTGTGRRESGIVSAAESSNVRAGLARRPSQPQQFRQTNPQKEPRDSGRGSPEEEVRLQLNAQRQPSIVTGTLPQIRGHRTVSLNENYKVRKNPARFFTFGRIIKVLWHQPSGADTEGRVNPNANPVIGHYNEPIYTTLRWMMVVAPKTGYAICCPISTYGGKGLKSKQLHQSEIRAHAIVYAEGSRPTAYADEPLMTKDPIRIIMTSEENLHPASRVHFGKYHTVEWNIKVMEIGEVDEDDKQKVGSYFAREISGQHPR